LILRHSIDAQDVLTRGTHFDVALRQARGRGTMANYTIQIETTEEAGDNLNLPTILRMIADRVGKGEAGPEYRELVRSDSGARMGRFRLISDD
jgi:hypothetical protein